MTERKSTPTAPALRFGSGPGGPGPGGPGPGGPAGHLMREKERAKNTRSTLRRLWDYLKQQRAALTGTVILVALTSGLGLLGPYLMGLAIDTALAQKDLAGLARIATWMIAVYLLNALLSWWQTYVMAAVSQRTVRDIRNDLFARLQTLPLSFFDRRPHGELMSRLTNDVENISNVLNESVAQLISSVLNIVGVAVVMLLINFPLAIVSLITLPLMMGLSQLIARYTRQGFRAQQEGLGALNGIIEETITGQRVVKAYARESAVIAQFDAANEKLRRGSTTAQVFAGTLGPLSNFVNNVGFAIVAGAGGWMAVQNLATVGTIASFINYARQFAMPLNQIANLYNTIQAAIAGAERVFEILDEAPEPADVPDAQRLEKVRGAVELADVCFGYNAETPVLKHVSLNAAPGQTIALVGPTGAGKTTIVNLLTRFYDIDAGCITIDGTDIRCLPKDDLRRQLGIVLQDTYLFADTVRANIGYGRLEASEAEIVAAARLANADPFIRRLPQGYDTPLTERGSNLSQGQRQLLAIARAILADPGILILDEATSSVDTRTEKNIQEALLRLMQGRTSFVIAHRLSTIREADMILVIRGGEIVERGDHAALLAQRGFYHHLYMSQFKGQTP